MDAEPKFSKEIMVRLHQICADAIHRAIQNGTFVAEEDEEELEEAT